MRLWVGLACCALAFGSGAAAAFGSPVAQVLGEVCTLMFGITGGVLLRQHFEERKR